MSEQSTGYGTVLSAGEISSFLRFIYMENQASHKVIKPVCIWGRPGIGKTELVKDFAAENNFAFSYCAPAQFEEMGDFHGIPHAVDGKTVYHPPRWVPTSEDRPGILLIDDFNRADERILRGLMQLFQTNGLMSWQLPGNWHIVCTANPEGSDYAITNLDDAMLTRMMHVTMRFDPKEWAHWALKNQIDERGVDFVLTYPEIAGGKMTNPRTLSSFFTHTRAIPDLKKDLAHVHTIGSSLLDKETATAFTVFIQDELGKLLTPEQILEAPNFNTVEKDLRTLCVTPDNIRIDILSAMTTRMLFHLKKSGDTISSFGNLLGFLLMDFLPNDLRASFHLELMGLKNERIRKVLMDKKLSKLIVGDHS